MDEVGTARVTWRKSTRSNGSGDCVEVADLGGAVGVRDSKDHDGPVLVFAPGRCRQMQVQVFSEEDLEKPIISQVSDATRNRVWLDFQDYRARSERR